MSCAAPPSPIALTGPGPQPGMGRSGRNSSPGAPSVRPHMVASQEQSYGDRQQPKTTTPGQSGHFWNPENWNSISPEVSRDQPRGKRGFTEHPPFASLQDAQGVVTSRKRDQGLAQFTQCEQHPGIASRFWYSTRAAKKQLVAAQQTINILKQQVVAGQPSSGIPLMADRLILQWAM